jgi:hypothetical protein
MESVLQDIRFAFRVLLRTPAFAIVAVLAPAAGDRSHHGHLQRGERRRPETAPL